MAANLIDLGGNGRLVNGQQRLKVGVIDLEPVNVERARRRHEADRRLYRFDVTVAAAE